MIDNNETLHFMQDTKQGTIKINASEFEYGTNWIVRIAKVTF